MAESTSFKWESLKPMPTKRVFSTAIVADGQLYIVGGCDQMGTPLDSFEVFNLKKKAWTRLLNMPTKRAGAAAVAVEKKIVVLGGVATNQEPLDACEIYDIQAKKWTTGEGMKEKLLGISAVVRDGKVLVIGGMGKDTNPKDFLMSYDIETNLWMSLPSMPTPRYATFSFLIGDKLYVLGGRQGKIPVAALEAYDFSTSKWIKLPDIPSKRVFALYVASEKHIYSLGGLNQNPKDGFSDTFEIFDIEQGEWKIGKPMTMKRGDFAASYIGGRVVAAGGLGNEGKPLFAAESYDPETEEWTALPDMPNAHCSCACIQFLDRLHVVGGLSMGGPSNCMEALSAK